MSNEDLEGFDIGLIREASKMKKLSDEIKLEIQNETINRLRVKSILFDLSATALTIRKYLKTITNDNQERNALGITREEVMKGYKSWADSFSSYAMSLDNEKLIPDSHIRNEILKYVKELTVETNYFETALIGLGIGNSPFTKILEFVAEKPMGLDEKWVAAACYLSSFDILINKKREELQIAKKPEEEKRIDFNSKFDQVVKTLESKHGNLSKIVTQLPRVFWQIRIQVIHYGYVPTEEELELIIKWSREIMRVISEGVK